MEYDVALSFAGEDREYVEAVANELKRLGVRVFYDNFETAELWGKDLYTHLQYVYQKQAKYTIIFISKYYAKKLWTNHERKMAHARAFTESSEYILPARFDNTEIEGITQTVGYIDLNIYSPTEFAVIITQKIALKNLSLPIGDKEKFNSKTEKLTESSNSKKQKLSYWVLPIIVFFILATVIILWLRNRESNVLESNASTNTQITNLNGRDTPIKVLNPNRRSFFYGGVEISYESGKISGKKVKITLYLKSHEMDRTLFLAKNADAGYYPNNNIITSSIISEGGKAYPLDKFLIKNKTFDEDIIGLKKDTPQKIELLFCNYKGSTNIKLLNLVVAPDGNVAIYALISLNNLPLTIVDETFPYKCSK